MATYKGSDYSETIRGTAGRDVIYGYGGHDRLYGDSGSDDLYGGAGDDDLYGGNGDDDLIGGAGFNDLWGGSGFDFFTMSARGSAGFSDDLIMDFQFDIDSIDVSAWGVSDFSQIQYLLREDSTGSATLNAYFYGYNHIVTIDGVGADELLADDFIYDASGPRDWDGTWRDDVLFGSTGDDVLYGASGHDTLLGGRGDDVLEGGSGDDDLVGGSGRDEMWGWSGEDLFIFTSAKDSAVGAQRDVIHDFNRSFDLIDLRDIDARPDLAGNQAFTFIGTDAYSGVGQLRVTYSDGNTIVSGNLDADSRNEFQFELTGIYSLSALDFLL